MKVTKNKKLMIWSIAALAAVIVIVCLFTIGPFDKKTISLTATMPDGTIATKIVETRASNLGEVLKETGFASGDNENGFYILTVNGVTADETKGQWWMISKGGTPLPHSVDQTDVNNGEQYDFALVTGYPQEK